MNYKLWQRQFQGDPRPLGTTLVLNGEPRTLVGIMPPRFQYADAMLWFPLTITQNGNTSNGNDPNQPRFLEPLGLRKPGVTLQAAAANLNVIAQQQSKVASIALEGMAAALVAARRPDLSDLDPTVADMHSTVQCGNIRAYCQRDLTLSSTTM
jgi:hypothetical protein